MLRSLRYTYIPTKPQEHLEENEVIPFISYSTRLTFININLHISETISFLRDIFVSTVDIAASWWQWMRRQLVCSSPYMKMHPHRNLTSGAQGHIPPDNTPTDTVWKIILDQSKCSFDLQIMFLSMLQNISQRFSDWFCPDSQHQPV